MTLGPTDDELAAELGKDERTLRRWRADGAPCARIDGRWRWDRAELRAWLAAEVARGSRRSVAPSSARRAAPTDLLARIRGARTLADLGALAQEVAALAAGGTLAPAQAQAVRQALAEARQTRAAQPPAGVGEEVFLTPEAAELAEAYEGILDGRVRAELRAVVAVAAAEDRARFPDELREDPDAMRAALAAAGLDAWGEPAEEEG